MKLLFIINPISGSTDKTFLFDYINQLEKDGEIELYSYETQPEGNEDKIKERLDSFNPNRVVVAGGDGTIQLVCKCMIESKSTASLGIVPTGSANGLATSMNLPKDLNRALLVAANSLKTQPIDVLLIDEKHYCVHLFDLGINALLIKYYEADETRGMFGYSKHMFAAISDSKTYNFSIITEKGTIETAAQVVICTNGNKFGTGVKISNGSISDGYFDITVIEEFSLEEIIKSGLSLFDIQLTDDQFEKCIKSKETTITTNEPVPFQIDGEYIGEVEKVQVKILESAIKIAVNE